MPNREIKDVLICFIIPKHNVKRQYLLTVNVIEK